jgi:hypothetical protein
MNAKKLLTIIIILLLCILFGITSRLIVSPTEYSNSDFFSFWLSGRMLQSSQNPYNAEGWIRAHYEYGAEWISDATFLYPLPLAFLFIPFGVFNLYPAFVVWVWLSQILLLVSISLLFSIFGTEQRHYVIPVALGVLLYRPVIPLLVNGQFSAAFLLVIVGTGMLWERKYWMWGGALLSLLFLKPNIGVPIIALTSLYLVVRKSYRGILGVGVGGVGILVLGLMLDSNWVWEYLGVLQSKQAETFGYSSTIWGLSGLMVGFDQVHMLMLGILLTAGIGGYFSLIVVRRKSITPLQGLALSVTTALLVTPYLWPYDQTLLILPILLTIAALKKHQFPYLVCALFFVVVDIAGWLLFGWTAKIQMENPNSLLTLLVFGLLMFVLQWEKVQPAIEIADSSK